MNIISYKLFPLNINTTKQVGEINIGAKTLDFLGADSMSNTILPENIRVSTGSAIVLGLMKGRLDARPTTVYLLTCREEKCSANCGFCPQARESRGRADKLSRVTWPIFPTREVVDAIEQTAKKENIKRVCIQTLNYPEVFVDILHLVRGIKGQIDVPVSVSCQPSIPKKLKTLAEAGVNRISIALDAATEELFKKVKGETVGGPYIWKTQREALNEAVKVFGEGSVSTHLIMGLGETEKELCQTIQWCVDLGVYPGLFAFTPIPGTALEDETPPPLSRYRRAQVAHHLLTHGKIRIENMTFDNEECLTNFGVAKDTLRKIVETGEPFKTSGCPGCNRPYYNERPRGVLYNCPKQPDVEEIAEAKRLIGV
jgi:biotin synthase-related radical SAM superfamily protein